MTVIASHLHCDCEKAIKTFICPTKLLSPSIKEERPYFYCPECKNDYICESAVHSEFTFDKEGTPVKIMTCVKCKTELERRVWPSMEEVL